MKFTIPIVEKISNNKLRTVHWGTRHSITKKYIAEVKKEMKKQYWLFKPLLQTELTVTFYFKNRPLDCSNCAGMVKMIEDGLVEAKVLKDDNPNCVRSVKIISKVNKYTPRIEIDLEE